jgi:hypothetical protein
MPVVTTPGKHYMQIKYSAVINTMSLVLKGTAGQIYGNR